MSINQEPLWSAKLPNGEVRSGTLQQLSEALRAGHVGEGTLVCASGSNQWSRLADILSTAAAATAPAAPAAAASAPASIPVRPPVASVPAPSVGAAPMSGFPPPAPGGDVWQVRLATGQIRSGTRQHLEEAFRAGHLTEDLLVLPSGAASWSTLGTVLGRSVAPPPVAPVAAPAAYSRPAPAPVAPAPAPAAPTPAPTPVAAPVATPEPVAAPAPGGDELWQVRMPDGQIRSGTRQQLEEAFRAGHLAADTLVLASGSSEWVPLAAFADHLSSSLPSQSNGHAEAAAEAPPEPPAEEPVAPAAAEPPAPEPEAEAEAAAPEEAHWQVRLTDAQLEGAVQAGLLSDDSLVLAVGTEQWVRLGDLRRAHQSDPA